MNLKESARTTLVVCVGAIEENEKSNNPRIWTVLSTLGFFLGVLRGVVLFTKTSNALDVGCCVEHYNRL